MDPKQNQSSIPTPDPTINFANGDPQMGILQKLSGAEQSGKEQDPEFESVNLLATAIKALNQYASVMKMTDDANARAARYMIKVLGAMLKTAQHDEQMETQGLTSLQ